MGQSEITELSTELCQPAPYYLGESISQHLPDYVRRYAYDRIFLVSSAELFRLFGDELSITLVQAGLPVTTVHIEEGEENKDWQNLSTFCNQLLAAGLTRNSILIALGGGLIGNIVGLAAGLIYRGIRFLQVPTTLMAQTDSVLSNKQAINGALGKNQFGLYHAPLFIWADVAYLRHEPLRQIRAAIVEGVKNGLIHDLDWLEKLLGYLQRGKSWLLRNLRELAHGLVNSKLGILRQDPSEKAYAVVLEYGHTFGHAIEFLSRGTLLHGEAVSIGMCTAARLSTALGLSTADIAELHRDILGELLGAPIAIPRALAPEAIYQTILTDNKRTGREPRFLLMEKPGVLHNPSGDYMTAVPKDDVLRALAAQRE